MEFSDIVYYLFIGGMLLLSFVNGSKKKKPISQNTSNLSTFQSSTPTLNARQKHNDDINQQFEDLRRSLDLERNRMFANHTTIDYYDNEPVVNYDEEHLIMVDDVKRMVKDVKTESEQIETSSFVFNARDAIIYSEIISRKY